MVLCTHLGVNTCRHMQQYAHRNSSYVRLNTYAVKRMHKPHLLKPHCGASGSPFIKSITGAWLTSACRRSSRATSLCPPFRNSRPAIGLCSPVGTRVRAKDEKKAGGPSASEIANVAQGRKKRRSSPPLSILRRNGTETESWKGREPTTGQVDQGTMKGAGLGAGGQGFCVRASNTDDHAAKRSHALWRCPQRCERTAELQTHGTAVRAELDGRRHRRSWLRSERCLEPVLCDIMSVICLGRCAMHCRTDNATGAAEHDKHAIPQILRMTW